MDSKRPSSSPTTTNTTTTTGVSSKSSLFPRSSAAAAPVSSIDIQESSASSDQVDILVDDREEKTPACVDDACVYPTNSSTKMGLSTESLGFSSHSGEDVAQCHEEGRIEGADGLIDPQDDDSKSSIGFKEEENITRSSGQKCETVPVLETMVVGTVPEVMSAPLVPTDSARFEIVNGTNDIDDDDVEVEEHEEEVHYEIFAQTQVPCDINEDGGEALAVDSVTIEKQIHELQTEQVEARKFPAAYDVEPKEEHAKDIVLTAVQKDATVSEESMPPEHVDKSDTLPADVKLENLEEYEKKKSEISENQIESNVSMTEKALSGTGGKQGGFDEHLSENNPPSTFEKQAEVSGSFSETVIPGSDESKGHIHTLSDQTDFADNTVVSGEIDQTTLGERTALEEKKHQDSKENIVAQVVKEEISAEFQSKQSSAVTTVTSSADVDDNKGAAASDRCDFEYIDSTFIPDISTCQSDDKSGNESTFENAFGDTYIDNNSEANYQKKSTHIPDADKDISAKIDLGTTHDANGAFPSVCTEQISTSVLTVEHPVDVANRMAGEEPEKLSEFGQVPDFKEPVEFKNIEASATSTDAVEARESAMHIKSEDPIEFEKTTESTSYMQSERSVELSNVTKESGESVTHVKSSVSMEKKEDLRSERPSDIEEPNESYKPSESEMLVESEKSLELECSVKEKENNASSTGNAPSCGIVEDVILSDTSENRIADTSTQKSNSCPKGENEPEHTKYLSAVAESKVDIQKSTMKEIADESIEGMVITEGKDTQINSQSCSDDLVEINEIKKGSSDIETSDHNANPTLGNKELQVEVEVHSDVADKPSEDFTIDVKAEASEDKKQAISSKQEVKFDIKSTKVTRSHEHISADIIKSELDEEEMLLEVGANEDLLDESSPDISLIHPIKADLNKITYTDNDTDNDGLDDDEMVDTEDRDRDNAKDEIQDKHDDFQKAENSETVTMSQSSSVSTKVCSENVLKTISNGTMQNETSETNEDNVTSNNIISKVSLGISKHQYEDDSSDSVFDTETLDDKVIGDKIRPVADSSSIIDSEVTGLTESDEQDNAKPIITGNDAKTDGGVDPALSTIISDIHITETKSVTVVSASSSESTTVLNRNVEELAGISQSKDIVEKERDFSADASSGSIGPVGEQSEQCDHFSDQVEQKISITSASSNSSETSQKISSSKLDTSLDEKSSGTQDVNTTFAENKAIDNISTTTTNTRPLETVNDIIIAQPDTAVNHSICASDTSDTGDLEIADVSLKLATTSSHDMTISNDSIAKDKEPSAQEDIQETKVEENRENETNSSSMSSSNEVNISEISEQSTPVLEGRPGSAMDVITMPEQDTVVLHETIKENDEIRVHEGPTDNLNNAASVEGSCYDESSPTETRSAEIVGSKQMETITVSQSIECNVESTRSKTETRVVGDTSSDGVKSQPFEEETTVETVSKSDTKLLSSADKIEDDNVVVNGKEALTSPET